MQETCKKVTLELLFVEAGELVMNEGSITFYFGTNLQKMKRKTISNNLFKLYVQVEKVHYSLCIFHILFMFLSLNLSKYSSLFILSERKTIYKNNKKNLKKNGMLAAPLRDRIQ